MPEGTESIPKVFEVPAESETRLQKLRAKGKEVMLDQNPLLQQRLGERVGGGICPSFSDGM